MLWTKLLAVVTLVAVAGCASPTSTVLPTERKSVVLVGDSISAGLAEQLDAVFGTQFGWNFSRHAVGGIAVVHMRDAIRARAALHPDAMVIELGTNDMGGVNMGKPDLGTQQVHYAKAIGQMQDTMDDMASVPCVVWVNVNTWSRVFDDQYDLLTWGPVYNERLVVEAAARPNVHVLDFAGAILAKGLPWMAANFDPILVHPVTIEAKQTVAEVMAQGVRNLCHI